MNREKNAAELTYARLMSTFIQRMMHFFLFESKLQLKERKWINEWSLRLKNNGLHSDYICREHNFKGKVDEMLKMFVGPLSSLVGNSEVIVTA